MAPHPGEAAAKGQRPPSQGTSSLRRGGYTRGGCTGAARGQHPPPQRTSSLRRGGCTRGSQGTASSTPGDMPTQEKRQQRDGMRNPRGHLHSGEAAAPGIARGRHPPPQGTSPFRRGGSTRGSRGRHPPPQGTSPRLRRGGGNGTASATSGDILTQEAAAPGAAKGPHPPAQGISPLRRGGCTRGGRVTASAADGIRHPRGHPHAREATAKGRHPPLQGTSSLRRCGCIRDSQGTASATPGDIPT